MAEVSVLVPELPIEVPDEMVSLFRVIAHIVHPATPIWKTTHYNPINLPSIQIRRIFIGLEGVSTPELSEGEHYPMSLNEDERRQAPFQDAGAAMDGRFNGTAKLVFAEKHVQGVQRRSVYGPVKDGWLLGIGASMRESGVHTLAEFAMNSRHEFSGCLQTLGTADSDRLTMVELNRDPVQLEEIAYMAGRILIPDFPEFKDR